MKSSGGNDAWWQIVLQVRFIKYNPQCRLFLSISGFPHILDGWLWDG